MSLRGLPDRPGYSQHTPVMYGDPLPLRPVSLRRCLQDRRRDPVSGVALGPASAALRYLLPVYDLERNGPASTGGLQQTYNGLDWIQEGQIDCHVTGSSIERLSVPPYTERAADALPHYRVADVDMMVEFKHMQVAARRGAGIFYMDTTRASHRGYTRVVFDAEGLTLGALEGMPAALFFKTAEEEEGEQGEKKEKEGDEGTKEGEEGTKEEEEAEKQGKKGEKTEENEAEKTGENEGEKKGASEGEKTEEKKGEEEEEGVKEGEKERSPTIYLSIDGVNTHLASQFQAATPGLQVHRQGPATNVQELKEMQPDSRGGAHSFIDDCDLVPALPLAEQPPELAAWLERVQGRRWPPEPLGVEIGRSGRCFLVGAGHVSSARRDLEWRLSFSEPERRLALSLTPQQRKVYVLIKMMQKCYLQQPKVLVTYHIKTLMFWELEECGDTEWLEEELFEHVMAMLDRIEACLERHYIPSYFIPDNNLISHASAEDVAAVLSTVRQIRRQPLQHLYGIDDRFRFDFSSPRPLSELHAPLREAVMTGGGGGSGEGVSSDAVAEALVLSLISQAQADVHRGLPVLNHCAHLLRDAWEALAAAGPEGAPHPVHEDWAVFAAAAVLTSMEAEESAHLTMAVHMAMDDEKRPTASRQLTEDEAQAASALIAPMLGGPDDPLSQVVRQAGATGTMETESPVVQMLSVRHAQLELLRDLKNRAQEQVAGSPPMSAAITSTRLQLGLVEMTYRHQLSCGAAEPEARLQVIMQTLAMTQSLLGSGGGAPSDLQAVMNQAVAGLGAPADLTATLQTALAPKLAQLCQQLAPATTDPTRMSFEKDSKITALIPLDMINVFNFCTLAEGLSEQVADLRYTAFFNMMGFFLKHRRYLFALRTVGRMTCLRLAALEAEMTRSVYQLNRAQLYLQQLPESVRALLRLGSCRAAIGVLYYFIDFVHLTFDWDLMTELAMRPAEDLPKMEKVIADTAPFAAPDVLLTHQLMLLGVLRILGRDTVDCLRWVAALGGQGVAEAAAAVLAGWCPPTRPQTGTAQEAAREAGSTDNAGGSSSHDATATEATATEATATEATVTGTMATEAMATEATATEAMATEAMATEAMATDARTIEPLTTEPPAAKVPATDVPAAETPGTEVPTSEEPAFKEPSTALSAGEKSAAVPDYETPPTKQRYPYCCIL